MNYGKLARLCVVLHKLLYVDDDRDAAQAYLMELESLLDELPNDDMSIVGAEGRAIYYELSGNVSQAIASRLREVDLMGQLYIDIGTNDYDETTRKALLAGRDEVALSMRKAIIGTLRQALERGR